MIDKLIESTLKINEIRECNKLKVNERNHRSWIGNGIRLTLVHDIEFDEWIVKWYDGNKYNEDRTYHKNAYSPLMLLPRAKTGGN